MKEFDYTCKGTKDFHSENRSPYTGMCPLCRPVPLRHPDFRVVSQGSPRPASSQPTDPDPPKAA